LDWPFQQIHLNFKAKYFRTISLSFVSENNTSIKKDVESRIICHMITAVNGKITSLFMEAAADEVNKKYNSYKKTNDSIRK